MNKTKLALEFVSENDLLEILLKWESNRKLDACRHLRDVTNGWLDTLGAMKLLEEIAKEWKL